jgi:alpha-amylase/alpha-mannosidase (GH57 family)
VERQPSARPEHDWNRRVARECYIPNARARIMDGHGRIVDLVNNYNYLSFNYGPTLLSWLEKAYPHDYRRLIDADRDSCRRFDGHGNAIAQAYNHMILPLALPRDMDTQIRWGLADFRKRFGREAEAMWLPETACNDAALAALAAHGLKYALLAPGQALRVRPIGAEAWTEVSAGNIDTRRAYRWSQGKLSLALFFYDGGLSHGVAFEKSMVDAKAWADRIAAAFDPAADEAQLVSICTDGESYGHHEHFGEMGLAHLVAKELPSRKVAVVNYGLFLAKNPPRWEVEIKPGSDGLGTSWSCSHGVARWTDACGCGAEGRQLLWRRPLREALDWLRDHVAAVFEREGGRILNSPWAARDAYIDVILDRSDENVARFMAVQLKVPDSAETRKKALQLLEMQRHALLMYTSCGWFFSDISGIEAVQNLQYAARAVDLAREAAGVDLEKSLTARLVLAPSNYSEQRDGENIYRKLALAGRVSEDQVAAHHAVSLLLCDGEKAWPVGHFQTLSSAVVRHHAAGARFAVGRVRLRSGVTSAEFARVFLSVGLPNYTLLAFVRPDDMSQGEYESLVDRVTALRDDSEIDPVRIAGAWFPQPPCRFSDLLNDERERVLRCIVDKRRSLWEDSPLLNLEECVALAEQHAQLGLDLPPGLRGQSEAALDAWLHRRARAFMTAPDADQGDIVASMVRARAAGLAAPSASAEEAWDRCFVMVMDNLDKEFNAVWLRRLSNLARTATGMGLRRWRFRAQNRFFELLKSLPAQSDEKVRLIGEIDEAARLLDILADV